MTPTASLPAKHQRGASLLESLVALVVLVGSTLAVTHVQRQLRIDGDLARQRAEAVRFGEEEMENLRAFAAVEAASGVRSYAAIADADTGQAAVNADYRIVRRVDAADFAGAKAVSVQVQWSDRSGTAREITLASFIARSDPMHAGALGLHAGTIGAAPRGVGGRTPTVPIEARDLGDSRSAWKPAAAATVALVFDNASGDIVARCVVAGSIATRDIGVPDLASCVARRSLLVSGTIRFTAALPPSPAVANDAPPEVGVALALTGGTYPAAPECFAEPRSVGADRFVAWHCAVAPRADGRWSGRANLVATAGWTMGSSAADRRVCRFAHDADASGAVDANSEHPTDYLDVATALPAQNFLVVRGDAGCPTAPAVRLTGEGAVVQANLGTLPHQP